MKLVQYCLWWWLAQNIRLKLQSTSCKEINCEEDDEVDYQPSMKEQMVQQKEFEGIKQRHKNITFTQNISEFLILSRTINIKTELTEQQQNEYYDEWIAWKNNIKYYSQLFSEKDITFSPQSDTYQVQLNKQMFVFELVPIFMVGFAIFYCFFSYKFKQIDWLNRQDQSINLSNILGILGLLVTAGGIALTIINLSTNRDITWDSNIKLRDISFKNYMTPLEIKNHLKLFKNISLYDINQKQVNFNLTESFSILNDYQQIHKSKITKFVYELENQETFIFKSVYFIVAILISLNINSLISNQFINNFKLYIGMLFLIVSCWGFLITGLMYKDLIQLIDICQQSQEIMNRQMPAEGTGYRYYIKCPLEDPEMQKLQKQIIRLLNRSFIFVKIRLMETGYSQELAEVTNIDQFFRFINQPKLQVDPYIMNYNVAINELNLAVQKLEVLLDCGYLRYFCKYQQAQQCYKGTYTKYKVLIGLFLISVSSYFSSISCLNWHIVQIKKNKKNLDTQKSRREQLLRSSGSQQKI